MMKAAMVVFLPILLSGCISIPARKMVETWDAVAAGEVIVVGKIELTPPLQEADQFRLQGRYRKYRKMAVLVTNRNYRPFTRPDGISFNGRIETPLDQTFFAALPAEPFYYMGAFVFLETRDTGDGSKAILPGGVKIDIRPTDQAVYIGTLRYYRDEFFSVSDVRVIDDYAEANEQFQARFGTRAVLRKALLRESAAGPIEKIAADSGDSGDSQDLILISQKQ